MKILVTGATGAVGVPIVRQLVAAGHEVVGLTRNAGRGEVLTAMGASFAVGDPLDRSAMLTIVKDVRPQAIIHEATALNAKIPVTRFDALFAETNRLRTIGTDNLLAAASECGIDKVIVQSFCGWPSAKCGDHAVPETHPFDANLPRRQRSTSYALQYQEAVVSAFAGQGVALRYGGFYGPGSGLAPGGSMIADIEKRRMPIVGDGGGHWSFIHVEDAAAATVAALEKGIRGVYNIVDDEPASVSEWLPYLARLVGAPAPMHLPKLVGYAFGGHIVSMMTSIRGGLNAKAKRDLGWQPRFASWREGFAAVFSART